MDVTTGNQTVNLANGRIIHVIGTNAGTPILTITPTPTSEALSNDFKVRNTSNASVAVTNALSGGTTVTLTANGNANLYTTPGGIGGQTFTSPGTLGEVVV